jgi:hypothetical protein
VEVYGDDLHDAAVPVPVLADGLDEERFVGVVSGSLDADVGVAPRAPVRRADG